MPADFNIAIPVVLENEGGYVNDPNDPGGETKFGISKRSYPNLDIKNLTREQAIEIYRHDFWIFGDLNSQAIATKMLDMYVNIKHHGIKIAQASCNTLGAHINEDGNWGPKTEATINGSLEGELLPEIRTEQAHYFVQVVAQNPALFPDLKGFLRRVQSC